MTANLSSIQQKNDGLRAEIAYLRAVITDERAFFEHLRALIPYFVNMGWKHQNRPHASSYS